MIKKHRDYFLISGFAVVQYFVQADSPTGAYEKFMSAVAAAGIDVETDGDGFTVKNTSTKEEEYYHDFD